ncbi:MAG: hypothetical protein AAGA23_01650 [Pseudomonadota bacterium]
MTFRPKTFAGGRGNPFYKALAHPATGAQVAALRSELSAAAAPVFLDPYDQYQTCDAFLNLTGVSGGKRYVVDLKLEDQHSRPAHELPAGSEVWVLDFGQWHGREALNRFRDDLTIHDLSSLKLAGSWLTFPEDYLSPLNFVYDLALFRAGPQLATRFCTNNYWARYGATQVTLRCVLYAGDGSELKRWDVAAGPAQQQIVIDSGEVRERFALPSFDGQLLVHAVGARGHDVLKYVLDFRRDGAELTTTHDSNIWPAARYGGIPLSSRADESVTLWIQNPHARPLPAGSLGLAGAPEPTVFEGTVPPLGTAAWRLPAAAHRSQATLEAQHQVLRPRYEVTRAGRSHVAHANIRRDDLTPDADFWDVEPQLGDAYLLTAPLLPIDQFESQLLVTPMSPVQDGPQQLLLRTYDQDGRELERQPIHVAEADDHRWRAVPAGQHLALSYDRTHPGPVDGWLHAIFRYRHRASGHLAETSFGSHMFNMLNVWRGEPQSYGGPAPGLTTRLYVRLGQPGERTFICLIYPASTRWHAASATELRLLDSAGKQLASTHCAIPLRGSRLLFIDELFAQGVLRHASQLLIRDVTCRLFGYHGLLAGDGDQTRFSIDHLFGF